MNRKWDFTNFPRPSLGGFRLHSIHDAIRHIPSTMWANQERTIILFGALLFSLMGSFVLWGPSQRKRKKIKSSTGVNGLVNMGETCFVNTLLQALAASPYFCDWLTRHQNAKIAQALLKVVRYVNGEVHYASSEVSLYPGLVVSALSSHGWSLGMGQQDSHELFFILMSTLEEQTTRPMKPQDILKEIECEETMAARFQQACDTLEPNSNCIIESPGDIELENKNEIQLKLTPQAEPATPNGVETGCCVRVPRLSFMWRASAGTNGVKIALPRLDLPFRGQQLSQLTCTVCSKPSVIQHQAFDCLSLSLLQRGLGSLEQLLSSFTAPELVHEVQCDHCTKAAGPEAEPLKTTFTKQLSIGRLPRCLCIHIQRTTWLSDGQSYKRHDYVPFPEVLVMDKFTYSYKEKIRRAMLHQLRPSELNSPSRGDKDIALLTSNGAVEANGVLSGSDVTKPSTDQVMKTQSLDLMPRVKEGHEPRNRYLLQAVVVHLGEVASGHFVTYRRPPNSAAHSNAWVCVSDEECHSCSLSEVMRSRAYMLFYEKM